MPQEHEPERSPRRIAVVVHRVDPTNIGDTKCAPNDPDYRDVYPWLEGAPEIDLRYGINAPRNVALMKDSAVVLGGGGLIGNTTFQRQMRTLLEEVRPPKLVVWGAGKHGSVALGSPTPETEDPRYRGRFDLIGMRDWPPRLDLGHKWCPCPSIKHPLIDQLGSADPVHDAVIFDHRDHPIPISESDIPPDRRLNNTSTDIEEVLEHISKGRVLITTSYHGALWATQMGRAVIVPGERGADGNIVPWSDKLVEVKHPPSLFVAGEGDWRQAVDEARNYPEARQDSLQAEDEFIGDVMESLGPELTGLKDLRDAGRLPLASTVEVAPESRGRPVPAESIRIYDVQLGDIGGLGRQQGGAEQLGGPGTSGGVGQGRRPEPGGNVGQERRPEPGGNVGQERRPEPGGNVGQERRPEPGGDVEQGHQPESGQEVGQPGSDAIEEVDGPDFDIDDDGFSI